MFSFSYREIRHEDIRMYSNTGLNAAAAVAAAAAARHPVGVIEFIDITIIIILI